MLISTTVSRLRPLQTHPGRADMASAIAVPSSLRLRRPLQVRAFRFGLWSSYLDSANDRELKRRYRELRHKYADIIGTKPTTHGHPVAGDPRCKFMRDMTPPGWISRWVDHDKIARRRRAPSRSPDAGPEIEDFLLHDLFISPIFRKSRPDGEYQNEVKTKHKPPNQKNHVNSSASQSTVQNKANNTEDDEYVIDPISNRKVSKRQQAPVEEDVTPLTGTPNTDGPHFAQPSVPNVEQDRQPVYSNGKPPASELDKYAENNFDDWPTTPRPESTERPIVHVAPSKIYRFDGPGISTLKNEEYSLNHLPLDDPMDEFETPSEKTEKQNGGLHKPGSQKPTQLGSKSQGNPEPDQFVDELKSYGPYMYNENSPARPESVDKGDLDRYLHYPPDDSKPTAEPLTPYDDLHEYVPTSTDIAKNQGQLFQQYGGLDKYKAFRSRYYAAHEQRNATMETSNANDARSHEIDAEDITYSNRTIPKMKLPAGYIFSNDSSSHTRTETSPRDDNGLYGKPDENAFEDVQQSSSSPAALEDADNVKKRHPEEPEKTILQRAEDATRNISRLKPSVIRRGSAMKGSRSFGADLYSKEAQGLETSFAEECGGRHTMPLYTRSYGSEPSQVTPESRHAVKKEEREAPDNSAESYYHRDPEIDGIPSPEPNKSQDQKVAQPDEPNVYKVLAYDPVSQTINIAETTSVVPDLASPVSPTEVLLRLSNPTKFLPHFAPLQEEGFEIVSGGGHMLVFRQVRPAKVASHDGTPYVNPIDMMGRSSAVPNAAAFVSPTGFVNYDIPRVEEELAEPSTEPNVNTRRTRSEGAASSGKTSSFGDGKKRSEKSRTSRMNLGERVIVGGAWVAGISYALGVVIEYFHTGGTDGKGPTGFSPS
ncbi:hypothetical protein NPX13_g10151 [Xylaria arbuscula]|uniref:Uncharacterized protein n=1 Tax=Xylaria arbuscula TaxID=114810 RepID=A0A9W8N5C9_9PEZI|nr:hypothetical protein NPX13_g10151 [Xylaria arbuscula]